ncbi:hypothetical protein CPB84DRAFT_1751614 [Gymnopilus junonius]|uniref:Uncharacterized protein n=1 Tax=Gymnopilus junonius TaxID=109634 RepID=A0A9P5NET1_GYMJU|nr:hypothetical protein CPB84DRAFT_1751614 [Gymnopilus junonius]
MKSFNFFAYVVLALALVVYAAPTSNVKDASNDEEFIGPLLRIGNVLPNIFPPRKVALPVVSHAVQKVAAPVGRAVGDVLGTAADAASEGLPVAGEVMHGLGLRDVLNADIENGVRRPKRKGKKAATAPAPPATEAEAETPPESDADTANAGVVDAPAADDMLISRDNAGEARNKKKKAKRASAPPPAVDAEQPAKLSPSKFHIPAHFRSSNSFFNSTSDDTTSEVATDDLTARTFNFAEEANKGKKKKVMNTPVPPPPSDVPDVVDDAPIAETSDLTE